MQTKAINILGIETSCDETAAAVVADGRIVKSSIVSSQTKLHEKYGGVVPEIASRAHIEKIYPVITEAMAQAGVNKDNIDSPVNVTMYIVSPGWNVQYEKNYENSVTVADLLFDCSEEHGFVVEKKFWSGYDSFFIEGIDGINNGEDDRYWQFYVNDNYSNVGCSSYYLKNDLALLKGILLT